MKTTIKIILLFSFLATFSIAQEVSYKDITFKYRKESLLVKDKKVFKLKYITGYFYIYDLATNEEVMYFYLNDNETISDLEDDYVKVYFTKSKKSFESKMHYRVVMERLINEKVITSEWEVDATAIDDFISKYDENISNRTIRNLNSN